jgi:hypothetical protein
LSQYQNPCHTVVSSHLVKQLFSKKLRHPALSAIVAATDHPPKAAIIFIEMHLLVDLWQIKVPSEITSDIHQTNRKVGLGERTQW